jgi:hypothetical protein
VIALAAIALIGALAAGVLLTLVFKHRTPRELRGDWWARFERDFGAYVARRRPPSPDAGPRRRKPPA